MNATTIVTTSEEETEAAGCGLAGSLVPGTVVLLHGELGAGKTAFVRGLAVGLGIDPAEVSSPTFMLVQEYRRGRIPLIHVDLYRLNDQREIEDLGLDEIASDGVLAVEWAEKMRAPSAAVLVRIEPRAGDARAITIQRESVSS